MFLQADILVMNSDSTHESDNEMYSLTSGQHFHAIYTTKCN